MLKPSPKHKVTVCFIWLPVTITLDLLVDSVNFSAEIVFNLELRLFNMKTPTPTIACCLRLLFCLE